MSGSHEPVDLTNCDREPIHQLGSVQPFGFLLAVSSDWVVTRASANLPEFLGVAQANAIGRPVISLITPEALHAIRNKLTTLRGSDVVERIFGIALTSDQNTFDLAVHLNGGEVIIEGERRQEDRRDAASLSMRSMMSRLDHTETLEAFFREGARQARALTGFDRVMVYRFDEGGSGEVVAEAARAGIGSFLGLHYPASDIPVQARALYLRNLFRIIADVDAVAVPILPHLDEHGRPLDLSMSVLRSVSPIHIEYLKNMGVGASLSISIVVDGRLWGLFACHHYGPRLPSAQSRSTAELFGQMFASRLESRERRLALDYETKARRIADRLLTSVADNASLLDDPAWLIEALADAIPADGVGVWINGRLALAGNGPNERGFAALVRHLNRNAAGRIYAVDRLAETYPDLEVDDAVAGMLAIPISRSPRDYVVLFRQELVRTVRWGGDPHKPVEYGPNGPRLTPRKSFEAWSELVRGRSLPFTEAERRVAETIRVTLIEVVLRLTDEVSMARQTANERQELLIAELNHRVRNILSLITGIIRQSQATSVGLGDYIRQLEGRIQSLARAHDQITRDHWAPASLRQLLLAETAAYLGKNAQRIQMGGEDVLLEPHAFSTAALVFHELMTNSAKYGSLSGTGSGTVQLGWHRDDEGNLRIGWREKHGPPVVEPKRHGFGSTIIRRSIPYDLGGKAEVRYLRDGLEADFCIPARHVVGPTSERSNPPPVGATGRKTIPDDQPLCGLNVLLVENNLIIAMDGEDILRRLGADVATAPSVTEAMEILAGQSFDLALLDVNLGDETSFGIADRLAADGVPFVFATGYGEGIAQANSHSDAPVLQKPYTMEGVTDILARVQLRRSG
ncbi:GAF domain-containing protein [Rhizobium leguminosarum bv. viciae]|uniref:HWE histidine kinase domain-containing protein n=1 Tax=Rhizobium ruizarguesonis TaxID=2081791 RepID=UPI00143F21DD|nr:HWE histidine kinase domain-containing protein [Rhizobium ruizarguesonis]MBC2805209.1 GAF domain-containing protein [Rhizobium ruizarguesonis]NKJ75612.1 GAF domain-containing protein [Rhizobium leguminosarum bv. viciae]NKQ75510.1 two-component system sensor histidine kinase/response regulator [Rhizobium ruizarguesonis]NKQ77194.1 two-component system sensor histidine kinase/response regulator [Rhizobium ruizarguesonis]